jgi:hypothetical protein
MNKTYKEPKNTKVGQRIGKLDIIKFDHSVKYNHYWNCKCVCGNLVTKNDQFLRNHGEDSSCGCDTIIDNSKFHTGKYHGRRNTPEYRSFRAMLRRVKYSKHYIDRGITVCDRWLDGGFAVFFSDMGEPPSIKHTIDRIDNDGNYEPSNCKWASPEEQQTNTSVTKRYEYNGKILTIKEWAIETEIPYRVIKSRLLQHKMSFEKAITKPYQMRSNRKNDLRFLECLEYKHCHNKKWVLQLFNNTKMKAVPSAFHMIVNSKKFEYDQLLIDNGKFFYNNNGVINQIGTVDDDYAFTFSLENDYFTVSHNGNIRKFDFIPSSFILFSSIMKDIGYRGMYKTTNS